MKLRTVYVQVGPDRAKQLAADLIEGSRWFEVTPLPEDLYEFQVKDECLNQIPGNFDWRK